MSDATDALARAAQAFLDHLTPGDTHTGCPERLTLDRAIEQAAEGQPVERGAAHTKRLSSTPSAAVDLLDVEALLPEFLSAETALHEAMKRLHKAVDTLAYAAAKGGE